MKTIALAGNPNSGKTTLFNALTGANQHVGNYPGVTVEKKTGKIAIDGEAYEVVDLPGTYSLTGYSEDEMVAREFLIKQNPDLVLCVVDASNLERSLNLTIQLIEMGMNVAVALNMVDVAESKGMAIDGFRLSQALGVPVASTVGRKGQGIDNLKIKIKIATTEDRKKPIKVSYTPEIDELIFTIKNEIKDNRLLEDTSLKGCVPFWVALKLIEGDLAVTEVIKKSHDSPIKDNIFARIQVLSSHVESTLSETLEEVISGQRYGVINSIVKSCKQMSLERRKNISDKIDLFLTHRFLGPILLFSLLYFSYQFTFTASEVPVGWLEGLFGMLHDFAAANLPDGLLKSLVVSGIIDGVGGVLGFTPLILFMFLLISLIEDSGYMARMAFLLDRILRMFGVHGNSIISYIVSGGIAGGCAVPGVMAARTLRDKKEKLATMLTVPFMNCGAKLPVFALLIAAFFPAHQGAMMFFITIFSWVVALVVALILRKFIFKGESSPFMMELPPYRMPTFRGLLTHTWQRTWMYVKKAGTFILAASIVIWAMMTFPVLDPAKIDSTDEGVIAQKQLEYSVAGQLGKGLEKVTMPLMGFDWKIGIALIGGAAAKEIIVSTLGTASSLGEVSVDDKEQENQLAERLQKDPNWNPLVAFCLIIFTMFYSPCVATLAVIFSETKSWKITAFAATYSTGLATMLAAICYHVGKLFM